MSAIQNVPRLLHLLRLLPVRLPGKRRLAQAMMNALLNDGPADISTAGLTFRVPSVREPVALGLIADGTYEPGLCSALQSSLRKDSVFFDVGANIGVFSLFASRFWCPEGRVFGFEASPQIYSHLQHNGAHNPAPGLHLFNRAVTAQSGQKLTFYNAPAAKFGMGSLLNRFGTEGVEVETLSLDTFATEQNLPRVDVIKIDVEGFELGVLQGSTRLLAQSPAPLIFFEFNDWAEQRDGSQAGDTQRFLLDHGYLLQRLDDHLAGHAPGRNVIETGGADLVATKAP